MIDYSSFSGYFYENLLWGLYDLDYQMDIFLCSHYIKWWLQYLNILRVLSNPYLFDMGHVDLVYNQQSNIPQSKQEYSRI